MDVSHSVCIKFIISNSFSKTEIFLVKDKLSPVLKHGFPRSKENVSLNKFQHLMAYEWWCVL